MDGSPSGVGTLFDAGNTVTRGCDGGGALVVDGGGGGGVVVVVVVVVVEVVLAVLELGKDR